MIFAQIARAFLLGFAALSLMPGGLGPSFVRASPAGDTGEKTKQQDLKKTKAAQIKTLEDCMRRYPNDHAEVQTARKELAETLSALGDYKAARALYEKIISAHSPKTRDNDSDCRQARAALANVLEKLEDFKGARAIYQKLIDIYSAEVLDTDPYLTWLESSLGIVLYELKDFKGAYAVCEKVYASQRRKLPDDHPEVLSTRNLLAVMLIEQKEYEKARARLASVVKAYEEKHPKEKQSLQVARANLSTALINLDRNEEALRVLEKIVSDCEGDGVPEDDGFFQNIRATLAQTLAKLGDLTRARDLQKKVVDIYNRKPTQNGARLKQARKDLAQIENDLKNQKDPKVKGQEKQKGESPKEREPR